jgi:hypothetical protein
METRTMTTMIVGPGIEAEFNYRRERVTEDFRRSGGRRSARKARHRRSYRQARPTFTARHA